MYRTGDMTDKVPNTAYACLVTTDTDRQFSRI